MIPTRQPSTAEPRRDTPTIRRLRPRLNKVECDEGVIGGEAAFSRRAPKERVIAPLGPSLVFHSIDFGENYANICLCRGRFPAAWLRRLSWHSVRSCCAAFF